MMIRYLAAAVMALEGCRETCEDIYRQHECSKHSDCGTGLACVASEEEPSDQAIGCYDGSDGTAAEDARRRICAPGIECTTTSPVDLPPPAGLCQLGTDCPLGQTCNLIREPLEVALRCECDKEFGTWDCVYDLARMRCGPPAQCPGRNPALSSCIRDAECTPGEKCLVSATETRPVFCDCYEGETAWQCESTMVPKQTCQPAP